MNLFEMTTDLPDSISAIDAYAEVEHGIEVTEDELWAVARKSKEIPNFSNLYAELVFSQLKLELEELYPRIEIEYFINNLDTHFNIGSRKMLDREDIDVAISYMKDLCKNY